MKNGGEIPEEALTGGEGRDGIRGGGPAAGRHWCRTGDSTAGTHTEEGARRGLGVDRGGRRRPAGGVGGRTQGRGAHRPPPLSGAQSVLWGGVPKRPSRPLGRSSTETFHMLEPLIHATLPPESPPPNGTPLPGFLACPTTLWGIQKHEFGVPEGGRGGHTEGRGTQGRRRLSGRRKSAGWPTLRAGEHMTTGGDTFEGATQGRGGGDDMEVVGGNGRSNKMALKRK